MCKQAHSKEKNSGEAGVYKKMLAHLVSWLGKLFNLNRLKCPGIINRVEVGNANSQHKYRYLLSIYAESVLNVISSHCGFGV